MSQTVMRKSDHAKPGDMKGLPSLPARRSLGQTVYERLKQAIIQGDLVPGSRMVESRLAETLGISRTPVREAIHKLEREGLLRRDPGRGYCVGGLDRDDIEETFGIRIVLESYASRLAAIRHREEELAPLEAKLDEYQRCLDLLNLTDLPKINTEFHDLLYGLSRSPRLIRMINDLRDQIYRYRVVILRFREMAERSHADHQLMLAAMRRRDADLVERLVKEHLQRGREMVMKELEN